MKIATLTYHRALNYGAVLQAYALQTAIYNLYPNVEVGVLDYRNKKIEDNRKIVRFDKAKRLKQNIYLLMSIPSRMKKTKSFDSFIKNRINLFSCNSLEDIGKTNEIDKYIVGSDQVWNFEFSGNDDAYMLSFVNDNCKKYSYAASIGKWDVEDAEHDALKLLSDFVAISVREKSAADIISSQIHRVIATVVDPVFLLQQDKWEQIEIKPKEAPDKYIFVYGFGNNENVMISLAKQYSKKFDAKIIMLKDTLHKYDGVTTISGIRPEEFVWLIHHASMVVTNSFHGTSFSIIFNKEFLSIPNIGQGSRIRELLSKFGLNNRLYAEDVFNNELKEIDWLAVEKKIANDVNNSYEYLREIISI